MEIVGNKHFKRIIAVVLVLCMVMSIVPMSTWALTAQSMSYENMTEEDQMYIEALSGMYGSETEAKKVYTQMKELGIVGDDSDIYSIPVSIDGIQMTMAEAIAYLGSDNVDPNSIVEIGGTKMLLGNFSVLMMIHEQVQQLEDQYLNSGITFDEQRVQALEEIKNQFQTSGINAYATDEDKRQWASGIDHQIKVSTDAKVDNNVLTISANIGTPLDYDIKFDYTVDDGSWNATNGISMSDTMTIKAGEKNAQVQYDINPVDNSSYKRYFFVRCENIENALFNKGTGQLCNGDEMTSVCIPVESGNATTGGQDLTNDDIVSVSVVAGDYQYGDYVPITYTFSKPVDITKVKVSANPPTETDPTDYRNVKYATGSYGTGVSDKVTFLYPSKKLDITELCIYGVYYNDKLITPNDYYKEYSEVEIEAQRKKDIIDWSKVTATVTEPETSVTEYDVIGNGTKKPDTKNIVEEVTVQFKLPINMDEEYSQSVMTVINKETEGTAGEIRTMKSLIAKAITNDGVKDVEVKVPRDITSEPYLYGEFVAPYNDTGEVALYGIEFEMCPDFLSWNNMELLMGENSKFSVKQIVYIDETAGNGMNLTCQGFPTDGSPVYVDKEYSLKVIPVVQNEDATWQKVADKDGDYTDFKYSSSDEKIATIDGAGNISLTGIKEGEVTFTVTATNGGFKDYSVETTTPLSVKIGLEPFLYIPNVSSTVIAIQGNDATVRWTTNLVEQNIRYHTQQQEIDPAVADDYPTTYYLDMYEGEFDDKGVFQIGDNSTPVYQQTIVSKYSAPVTNHTIPAKYLTKLSDVGKASYLVKIKSLKPNASEKETPTDDDYLYTEAKITVQPKPATVHLGKLNSYYITDSTSSLPISWNFEELADGATFEASYKKNDGESVILSKDSATTSATLPIDKVDSGLMDTYTVTTKVKNTSQTEFSEDSYVVYVYNSDALKICIDGVQQTDLTMTNYGEESKLKIDQMTSDQILALNRKIDLQNQLSINYSEYEWGQFRDQVQWAITSSQLSGKSSEFEKVATINYAQGGMYDNIDNFVYTSYAPASQFMLAGLNNGQETITATHAATGMQQNIQVNVKTLKDKLCIIQAYPKTTTDVSYTNGNGEAKTLQTDSSGAIAIYDEFGIASDVNLKSKMSDGTLYMGTIPKEDLKSGEQDASRMLLYPQNNYRLQPAAQADIYLKNPDGTNYEGNVIMRAGSYKNMIVEDEDDDNIAEIKNYCANQKYTINNATKDQTDIYNRPGDQDIVIKNVQDGKIHVTMDPDLFYVDDPSEVLVASDVLKYYFELQFDNDGDDKYDDCNPVLVRMSSQKNEGEVSASSKTVDLKEPKNINEPFISSQYTHYGSFDGSSYDKEQNLEGYTGEIGPTDEWPEMMLESEMLLWGAAKTTDKEELSNYKCTVKTDDDKYTPCQKSLAYPYEFTSMNVIVNEQQLDEEMFNSEAKTSLDEPDVLTDSLEEKVVPEGEKLTAHIEGVYRTKQEQSDKKCVYDEPTNILNYLGTGKASEAESVTANEDKYTKSLEAIGMGFAALDIAQDLGNMVQAVQDSDTSNKMSSIRVSIIVVPTTDPGVFSVIGRISAGDADTDISPGVLEEQDAIDNDISVSVKPSEMKDLDKKMKAANEAADALSGLKEGADVGNADFKYKIGGYFEGRIGYNVKDSNWELTFMNGGILGSLLGTYTINQNIMAGIVPVNVSVEFGASASANIGMGMNYGEKVEATYHKNGVMDLFSEIQLYAYIEAFVGVGVDFGVFALKLGVFGNLGLKFDFNFLTRSYTANNPEANKDLVFPTNGDSKTNNGQEVAISGQLGLKFMFKAIFIEFEYIFASIPFKDQWDWNQYKDINDYWTMFCRGSLHDEIFKETFERAYATGTYVIQNQTIGSADLSSDLYSRAIVESRDYLNQYDRSWGNVTVANSEGITAYSEDNDVKQIAENVYPYAGSKITDDGAIMVSLHDNDSDKVEDTRACYSFKNSDGTYTDPQNIITDDQETEAMKGNGDSSIAFAGTQNFAAVAWVRQFDGIQRESGKEITVDDQHLMMNSSEIMTAVYKNGTWTPYRLTTNSMSDLSPVVATSNGKVLAVWRCAYSSNTQNPTDFSGYDYLMYSILDTNATNAEWSEPKALYNGTQGNNRGVQITATKDGTFAVAFEIVKTDSAPQALNSSFGTSEDSEKTEVLYSIIDPSKIDTTEPTVVRLTNNDYVDENPQITTANLGDEEKFVLAWHSVNQEGVGEIADNQETVYDINLTAFDKNGVIDESLPQNLSSVAPTINVGTSFTFAKSANTKNIDDLYLVWSNSKREEVTGNTDPQSQEWASYGEINGVKFYEQNDGQGGKIIKATDLQSLAKFPEDSAVDSYDTYITGKDEVTSVVVGTIYDRNDIKKTGETNLYKAVSTYKNDINLKDVDFDSTDIFPTMDLPVTFSVENKGVDPITQITLNKGFEFEVGTGQTTKNVTILPGKTASFTVYYSLPADLSNLSNVNLEVTANFEKGTSGVFGLINDSEEKTKDTTLEIGVPNLYIPSTKVINSEDGKRTFSVSLGNDTEINIQEGTKVTLALYKDSSCTAGESEIKDDDGNPITFTIDKSEDIQKINESVYSTEFTVNLKKILEEGQEVPEGMNIYVKATMTDAEGKEVSEVSTQDNTTSVAINSLGTGIYLVGEVKTDENANGEVTKSTVTLRNNELSTPKTNNLIVYLLDQDGNIVDTRQKKDVTLAGEEKKVFNLTFDKLGTSVKCEYSDKDIGASSLLTDVKLTNSNLDTFTFDKNTQKYDVNTLKNVNITDFVLSATKEDENATLTYSLNGGTPVTVEDTPTISGLKPDEVNTLVLTCVSSDGYSTHEYDFKIYNGSTAPSSVTAQLSSLSLTNDKIPTISFDKDTYEYYLYTTDGQNVDSAILACTPVENAATITFSVNDGPYNEYNTATVVNFYKNKENTVKIHCLVGTVSKDYTIHFYNGDVGGMPISNIKVTDDELSTYIFDENVHTYNLSTQNSANIDQVRLEAVAKAKDTVMKYTINGTTSDYAGVVDVALVKDKVNNLVVTATTTDGQTASYTFNITNGNPSPGPGPSPGPEPTPSPSIDNITLTGDNVPAFDFNSKVKKYVLTTEDNANIDAMTLKTKSTNVTTFYSLNGADRVEYKDTANMNLVKDSINTLEVIAVGTSGNETSYTFIINNGQISSNANVKSINISGQNVPALNYDPNKHDYELYSLNNANIDNMNIKAIAENESSTIEYKLNGTSVGESFNLKANELNTIEVICTSITGTQNTYVIKIHNGPQQPEKKEQWEQIDGKWVYYDANGNKVTSWQSNIKGWEGQWFYFDDNGFMLTGWQNNIKGWEGQWFYFASNGVMAKGWQQLGWSGGTSWFYFQDNGVMVKGWQNNIPGWIGEWFFFNDSGAMQTGWVASNGKWYYLGSNGVMLRNCYTPDGYWVDESGAWS